MPQWERTPGGAWQPVSPGLYRGLLNAFYAGVKSAVRSDVVLAAGTAPYGDPPGTAGGRMFPVTFLQGLFCLTPSLRPQRCSDPPRLDALDHHPYSATPLSTTRNRGDIGVVQLYKIQRIVAAARRYRHVLPDGPKPLWVTEIDWLSTAPNTPEVQAQYLAQSFYELWRQGVTHVFWFEMRDPPPSIDPGGPAYLHTGLYEADGAPKPAIAAYRFPFVALSGDVPRTLILWGRAPARGTVLIQRLIRGRWRRFAVLRTTSGGIFYAVRKVGRRRQPRQFRAVIGRRVSPIWVNG
jgi:hypothetical protein